jgi:maltose alpha-D-glucosyltransferase/alpha-amylase
MANNRFWYKDAVFYEVNVRAYYDSNADGHGDIPGLIQKLDYLHELGVDCLWLQPMYPSPLRDDGYDISDFYSLLPQYGTVNDLKLLLDRAHERGIRVIMDLVMNHTSDQHPWFQAARADRNSPYRDYYVWSDSDRRYSEARIIFLDTEPSNWTWDEMAGQYYWHRFYASQPDLNYDNPAGHAEMLKIVQFWLELGIDGFRADAIPYLYEREGTNCENLPETHAYLKKLRKFIDENFPGRILLAEANQWPEDVREYFGDGTDEFHMGFHFPLMPRIFKSLKSGERSSLEWILEKTPALPEACQWCTFLRNHDELTLEMVTEEERQWMWEKYAPDPRMRLNLGIRRRLAPLLDNDRAKIELANSLLFTMQGSPILYYGDEIGMGDNLNLPDRNGVRTPMQWDDSPHGGFTTGQPHTPMVEGPRDYQHVNVASQIKDPNSLFHVIRRMIAIRKEHPAFGNGSMEWVETGNPSVAAYLRQNTEATLLIFNNLSAAAQTIELPAAHQKDHVDLFTREITTLPAHITLAPYSYRWLRMRS